MNIRDPQVKFHDGTPLTAHDVKATCEKVIFSPDGVPSVRKAFYRLVKSVEVPDDYTVIFKLAFPSGAFIPALASPFNFVYSKKDLDQHGYKWHMKNVNGTGPFIFVQHQPGSFVEGRRNPGYHGDSQNKRPGDLAMFASCERAAEAVRRGGKLSRVRSSQPLGSVMT